VRDVHFDANFLRDFNAASEQWTWANWHQIRDTQGAVAQRLLEQVFGPHDDHNTPAADHDESLD